MFYQYTHYIKKIAIVFIIKNYYSWVDEESIYNESENRTHDAKVTYFNK